MRETKFRAFIKDIGVMCPVGALYFGRNYDLEGVSCHIPNGYVSTKNVADVYLMQCTGLEDKNGVEIYEGDIVAITNHPFQKTDDSYVGIEINGKYEVRWCEDDLVWCAGCLLLARTKYYVRVIGNIYQNPELLEGE